MREIPLTQGKVALVDDDAYECLSKFKWYAYQHGRTWYAKRVAGRPTRSNIRMHRVIAGAAEGVEVDHINGDGLDNRKENLRMCSRAENTRNRQKKSAAASRYKGLTRAYSAGEWQARIRVDGKLIDLGTFASEEAAAEAYNAAALRFFGAFARLNRIEGAAQ